MTTPETPYDVVVACLEKKASLSASERRGLFAYRERQSGYLRALADVQPRIDALVAALEDIVDGIDQGQERLGAGREEKARAALAAVGKE